MSLYECFVCNRPATQCYAYDDLYDLDDSGLPILLACDRHANEYSFPKYPQNIMLT